MKILIISLSFLLASLSGFSKVAQDSLNKQKWSFNIDYMLNNAYQYPLYNAEHQLMVGLVFMNKFKTRIFYGFPNSINRFQPLRSNYRFGLRTEYSFNRKQRNLYFSLGLEYAYAQYYNDEINSIRHSVSLVPRFSWSIHKNIDLTFEPISPGVGNLKRSIVGTLKQDGTNFTGRVMSLGASFKF
jgi:hypothetical protein